MGNTVLMVLFFSFNRTRETKSPCLKDKPHIIYCVLLDSCMGPDNSKSASSVLKVLKSDDMKALCSPRQK